MSEGAYGTDAELVEALRRNDREALWSFVQKYGRMIEVPLERVGMDEPERDRVASQLVERLIRGVAGTHPVTDLRPYIARAATHAAIDWIRTREALPQRDEGVDVEDVPAEDESGELAGRNHDALRVFSDALHDLKTRGALKDRELAVLHMRAKGFEFNEIAQLLPEGDDLKKEAARWRKRYERARDKLKEAVRERAEREPEHVRALLERQNLLALSGR